jgi:hypothetical protein
LRPNAREMRNIAVWLGPAAFAVDRVDQRVSFRTLGGTSLCAPDFVSEADGVLRPHHEGRCTAGQACVREAAHPAPDVPVGKFLRVWPPRGKVRVVVHHSSLGPLASGSSQKLMALHIVS